MTEHATQGAVINYGTAVGRVGVDAVTPATDTYTALGQVQGIVGPAAEKGTVDVSNLSDTAKRFVTTIPDHGTITMTIMLDGTNAGHQAMHADASAHDRIRNWQIQIPDDTTPANRTELEFEAEVTGFSLSMEQDAAVTAELTLKVSGGVTVTWHA